VEINEIKVQQAKVDKNTSKDYKQKYTDCTYRAQSVPNFEGQYTPQMFGILPNFKLDTKTVSFKGAVLKKSDFKGSDLAVIERYKPNIQQFKSKEDLQIFAENKIKEIFINPNNFQDGKPLNEFQGDDLKDFGGRQEETRIQRKAMLKEWFDYVIKENDAYSNTQRLIVLNAITKDLKSSNDAIPPVLNKGVLADTITELEEKLNANPKENFDFNKMYQNNLRKTYMQDFSTGETMTGWVIIPSKKNDPENFEKNVEKLKTLSHNSWCTKSYNAEPYLTDGDFHVYLENGQPKLGVRFNGQKVHEIQGEKNNGRIPIKYLEIFKEHQSKLNIELGVMAKKEVQQAEKAKTKLDKIQNELNIDFDFKTSDDVAKFLSHFNIQSQKTPDNKLIISDYDCIKSNFDDLGIDENKLFEHVIQIEGNADFRYTNLTDLGSLEIIGGCANFSFSGVPNLGKLKEIGKHACFTDSKITSLGNLEYIGGNANLEDSQIESLGKLKLIGGNLKLGYASLKTLGDLEAINGCVNFSNTDIEDLGNLESIGKNATFSNSKIKSLGKLQNIGGDANFSFSDVIDLGNLKYIGDFGGFADSNISDLKNLVFIGGDANFKNSKITNLGGLKHVGGKIFCDSDLTFVVYDFLTNSSDDEFTNPYTEENDNDDEEDYYRLLYS